MAAIIPSLGTIRGMTTGERRFGRRLEALLEDDYTVWYDIPVGRQRRYPDFIILHPSRGLLFLEVKDWKLATLKKISKDRVTLQTHNGLDVVSNPLEQARQYAPRSTVAVCRYDSRQATTSGHQWRDQSVHPAVPETYPERCQRRKNSIKLIIDF